ARQAAALRQKLRASSKRPPWLLPASSLQRLLRGVPGVQKGFGVQAAAVTALQAGCEVHLLALLQDWGQCALHAKRAVVRAADVKLVKCLRGDRS
ncbi:H3 protein, partial [Dromaius novaehollandiae]|nr:H3 protein [Dromaius novaehollandiae]